MSPGQVSPPINTELGVHILQLVERDESTVNFRQILLRIEITEQNQAQARARAAEVVEKARGGQDFAALATEYSDDPGTREQGGLLGTFTVDQLSPQFQAALRGMQPGEVTDPIDGAAGYFVLKLIERAEGNAPTYEDLEDRMRQAVFDQKLESELEVFLGELRERFYIEVKA
jgi:parvulin-like peptidyl-prolyl isomerase